MITRIDSAPSYDGADQGFLNSYYTLTGSPLYMPNLNAALNLNLSLEDGKSTYRLSTGYNGDIGVYYLHSSSWFEQPQCIQFTLGPFKPWLWWSYPVVDLNWMWQSFYRQLTPSSPHNLTLSVLLTVQALTAVLLLLCWRSSAGALLASLGTRLHRAMAAVGLRPPDGLIGTLAFFACCWTLVAIAMLVPFRALAHLELLPPQAGWLCYLQASMVLLYVLLKLQLHLWHGFVASASGKMQSQFSSMVSIASSSDSIATSSCSNGGGSSSPASHESMDQIDAALFTLLTRRLRHLLMVWIVTLVAFVLFFLLRFAVGMPVGPKIATLLAGVLALAIFTNVVFTLNAVSIQNGVAEHDFLHVKVHV